MDDPLRLLRLPRIAHELGFDIDPASERLASSQAALASRPSGERIFMEMKRLLGGDRPAEALRLADRIGVLEAVLPEVAPMRGVTQSGHHQLDVWEHTLHVVEAVADIAEHPEHYLPRHAQMVGSELAADAGDELTVTQALRLAALFHDISKPQTRVQTEARVSFMGHDREGADAAAAVLARWKASNALIRFCRVLVASTWRSGSRYRSGRSTAGWRIAICGRPSPGRRRAWCYRWPTAWRRAGRARVCGTCAATARRPTSCWG